jgi:DNA-binding NarL/FixJ family response regulator
MKYMNIRSNENMLKELLEKLNSQVSAYRDVMRIQYPNALPMMQILQEMSKECLELANSQEAIPVETDNPLTKRELEVLTQVSKGLLNKEIAFVLNISVRTVEFHLKAVFEKTKTQGRTEASIKAIKNGWITY